MCGHHHHLDPLHTQHQQHGPATTPATQAHEDPKRILQVRYARGEISREEYLQMLKDLEDPQGTTQHQGHQGHQG